MKAALVWFVLLQTFVHYRATWSVDAAAATKRTDDEKEAERRRRQQQQRRQQKDRPQTRREKQKKQQQQYDQWRQQHNQPQQPNEEFQKFFRQKLISFVLPKAQRDIWQGVKAALRSALLGGSLSLTSLVVVPLAGIPQKKFLMGCLAGVLGSVTIVLATVVKIAYQLVTGILSTPKAIIGILQGRIWDPYRRKWIKYDLAQEEADLEQRRLQSQPEIHDDQSYYKMLGVPYHASRQEIKKAYYKIAKQVHPDKNIDSSSQQQQDADQDFIRLHKAYQTLSNDKKRADYDAYGTSPSDSNSASGSGTVRYFDASIFFAIFLDASETSEKYMGEISAAFYINKLRQLALLSQQRQKPGGESMLKTFQVFASDWSEGTRRRQVEIARHLLTVVQDYVMGSISIHDFEQKCRNDAVKISKSALGREFLEVIGSTLRTQAAQFLRYKSLNPIIKPQAMYHSLVARSRRNLIKWNMLKQTVALATTMADIEKRSANKRIQQNQTQMMREILPSILDWVRLYVNYDASAALEAACRRLFVETHVSRKIRRERARALKLMGEIMLQVRSSVIDTREKDTSQADFERFLQAVNLATMSK